MYTAMKIASNSPHVASISLRAALFHSTPVSDRKRRTHWDSGVGSFRDSSKRHNSYAKKNHLFESWKEGDYENDPSSSRWFKRKYWDNGTKRNSNGSWGFQWRSVRRNEGFQFCYSDGEEVETIFRSATGGERVFRWSFNSEKDFNWRNSSGYSNYRSSWNWRFRTDEGSTDDEDDTSTDCYSSESVLASDRQILGLSASGPLNLEEVKNAYRACALRWHPDRHQGPSKVAAEEQFKHCSVAYQNLCDKLATCSG
ncbi:dnaJ subfamily C member 7 [Cinnamomum micranthum f. kanehirae]|uniref:DnaJ subfamily C member 7 n=1 Tax=Cinnamomum micranthum f. kanehirae TaxID=337451 RepID=A0A3S3MXZ6_9MAGN|nr:dnaJ subfamily C member 7 [Cinnamomum micranthum f. kanehirae]